MGHLVSDLASPCACPTPDHFGAFGEAELSVASVPATYTRPPLALLLHADAGVKQKPKLQKSRGGPWGGVNDQTTT